LTVGAALCGIALRFILIRRNKQLARLDDPNSVLTENEIQKLQRTAANQGTDAIDAAAERRLQQGFRYAL